MNRRVVIVVGFTFCALVAATVWVPTDSVRSVVTRQQGPVVRSGRFEGRFGGSSTLTFSEEHSWVWQVGESASGGESTIRTLRWRALVLELLVIIALGGVLALFLRTRALRAAALQ